MARLMDVVTNAVVRPGCFCAAQNDSGYIALVHEDHGDDAAVARRWQVANEACPERVIERPEPASVRHAASILTGLLRDGVASPANS